MNRKQKVAVVVGAVVVGLLLLFPPKHTHVAGEGTDAVVTVNSPDVGLTAGLLAAALALTVAAVVVLKERKG